jgi:hypothetical protein
MLTRTLLGFCILGAFLLLGCSKTETTNNGNVTASNSNKAAMTKSPATSTASSSAEKVGVPECDDYIAKYDACVSGKVPEMARAQYKAALDTLRSSWRQAASTPQGKAGLAAACKQATEQARAAMKAYNCSF